MKNYTNPFFDFIFIVNFLNIVYFLKLLSDKNNLKSQLDDEFLRASKSGNLSIIDPLTGIYNRRHFNAVLDRIYEESNNQKTEFSLMIIDIDHFKRFNDTYGHDTGDIVLKTVVDTIKNNIRKNLDMFFRFGGEEFVIITSDKKDGAIKLAQKLNGLDYNHVEKITISIGVSFFRKGVLKEELIKIADMNLYKAKETGRNRVVFEDN
jgi:two-component system cell cycle response regulator